MISQPKNLFFLEVWAKFISIIFYPSLIQAFVASYFCQSLTLQIAVWVFSLLIPVLLSVIYLSKVKMPQTWIVPREYRLVPLSFAIISNFIFFWYFYPQLKYPVLQISLSALFFGSVALPITFFWKISLHTMGMGAISGFLIFHYPEFSFWKWFFLIVCNQQVAWARVFLKSHDYYQITAGFISGFFCYILATYLTL